MASNINFNNIDQTFPVAGVDNDSQGFRTNFLNIKNNFQYTKSEIEDLQGKVILKSALTGTTLNNNLNGAVLNGAEIYNFKETVIDLGSSSGTITLDHSSSHYYTVSTSGSVSLAFSNLPSNGKLGRIKLEISITNEAHTITLPAAITQGLDGLTGLSGSTITFANTGDYVFEFTTVDNGTTIRIQDLRRPLYETDTNTIFNTDVANFARYSYANVGNNFTRAVTNNLILDSNQILNLGNVYLPAAAMDGQVVSISSNNEVQSINFISNSDTIIGNVGTLAANSFIKYQYIDAQNKWFRIG
jgi:hypothetical protein